MSAISFKKGAQFLVVPRQGEIEPSLPPISRQVINFTKAVTRAATSMLNGNPMNVSAETQAARQAICEQCDFYRASDGRCSHRNCGCFTSERRIIASKTQLFSEFCPDIPPRWTPGEIAKL